MVSLMYILFKAKFPGNVSAILAEQLVLAFQHAAASWPCLLATLSLSFLNHLYRHQMTPTRYLSGLNTNSLFPSFHSTPVVFFVPHGRQRGLPDATKPWIEKRVDVEKLFSVSSS